MNINSARVPWITNNLGNDCTVDLVADDDIDDWHQSFSFSPWNNMLMSFHSIACFIFAKRIPVNKIAVFLQHFIFLLNLFLFLQNFQGNCITWFQAFVFFYWCRPSFILFHPTVDSLFTVLCRARLEFVVILLFRWWKKERSKMFIPFYVLWSRQESKCDTDFVTFFLQTNFLSLKYRVK